MLEDAEENLRQIREARRQADWVIMSLHNQDMIGRSWLKAQRRVDIENSPSLWLNSLIDASMPGPTSSPAMVPTYSWVWNFIEASQFFIASAILFSRTTR